VFSQGAQELHNEEELHNEFVKTEKNTSREFN
jgi:hypothetical protein